MSEAGLLKSDLGFESRSCTYKDLHLDMPDYGECPSLQHLLECRCGAVYSSWGRVLPGYWFRKQCGDESMSLEADKENYLRPSSIDRTSGIAITPH